MHRKVKNYSLVFCLFVFLFVIIGGGLHLIQAVHSLLQLPELH
ncbi:MAG TPA: hypothetical protein VFC15_14605 [Candidatus Limnocylindrales bacterium]|jgi:hypothetical protein|nr:hypothetical protein [Candidatus Limnocylindrales bacterium]HZM11435.1 hypothetical protein [Candidatus Limnocylindrales bacterium]